MKQLTLDDLTFIVDTREQRPLDFPYEIPPDSKKRVKTIRATLETGDYSIKGLEKPGGISIERKSLPDLLGVIGNSRERFEREIERILDYPCRLLAIEAHWDELRLGHWRGKIKPKQVTGSLQGWAAKGLPFFCHPDRRVVADFIGNMMFIHARRLYREGKFKPE